MTTHDFKGGTVKVMPHGETTHVEVIFDEWEHGVMLRFRDPDAVASLVAGLRGALGVGALACPNND